MGKKRMGREGDDQSFFNFCEFVFVCPYCTYWGKGERVMMLKEGGVWVCCRDVV